MNRLICQTVVALAGLLAARAQGSDPIGLALLRTLATNVDGTGIRVAQPEANLGGSPPVFEVNPASVGQPVSLFTYYSADGSTNIFTNNVGAESWHADGVAQNFYGWPGGAATNVAHVDNYDADFFVTNYLFNLAPMPAAAVVNQSYTFGPLAVTNQQAIDSAYDDYADTYGTLFVSAADNFGNAWPNSTNVCVPGTAYNCISVGAYANGTYYSSIGPTSDNGRCKPDLTAPAGATSFSTPQVAGAATALMQAALRGDGGSDTNAAFDMRTIKALLLNGAVKTADWTNSNSSPLDFRYGAGVLNVFNAYEQLAGGKQNFCASNAVAIGAAHPPLAATNFVAATSGWSFGTISSGATNDSVNHYFFNVSNGMAIVTLVWNRSLGQTNYSNCINDLDLFLFNAANSNLVTCSTSRVDNVEHLFIPRLPAGRYDLQVLKNGGTNVVSAAETYALAFALVPTKLNFTGSGPNAVLTWPAYPAGFLVETTTNLAAPAWSTNNLPAAALTNRLNFLQMPMTNALQFFRLRLPNF